MKKIWMTVIEAVAVTAILALSLIATGGDAYARSSQRAPAPAPAPAPATAVAPLGISWEGISWE